jgi:hypothetical protein
MDRNAQFERVQRMFHYGASKDADGMERTLKEIIEGCEDLADLYGICYFFGVYGGKALRELHGKENETEGFFTIRPEELAGKDVGVVFAYRFVTACANDDPETALALFNAAYEAPEEETGMSISALSAYVTNLATQVSDKKKAEAER